MRTLFIISILISVQIFADPVSEILNKAHIVQSDGLHVRVGKLLTVLPPWLHRDDIEQYSHPPAWMIEKSKKLYSQYAVPMPGQASNMDFINYNLDSKRTVEEMLSQQIGGYCGTHGLALGELLLKSGWAAENLRVVGGVFYGSYNELCPQKNQPRLEIESSASGHVFVAGKENGKWFLINSTSRQPELVEISSPDLISQQMASGAAWKIPNLFPSLQSIPDPSLAFEMTNLIYFQIWKMGEYPIHSFRDRLDMVASGYAGNKTCRFDIARGH